MIVGIAVMAIGWVLVALLVVIEMRRERRQ